MNPERLLQHFDTISEAPDAVARLRRLILDLAVRGKLVEQDACDEPVEIFIDRLQSQRGALSGAAKHKNRAVKQPESDGDGPFDVPSSWRWVNFADYAFDISTGPFGSILHQSDYVDDGVPLVNPSHMLGGKIVPDRRVGVSQEIAERLAAYRLAAGDIVVARRGEVGRAAVVHSEEAGWLCGTGSFFVRLAAEICRDYLLILFRSEYARAFLAGEAVGITMFNLNHGILKRLPLPIPPLPEQRRIVAKVDELMALCDQLQAARDAREQQRDRLVSASLHRLTASAVGDGEAATAVTAYQATHTHDHLQQLPRVTTRLAHIKQLRQAVLDLAMCGRLVSQDSSDEPVSELLKRIQAVKKGGSSKKNNSDTTVSDDQDNDALPLTWVTVELSDISSVGTGATPLRENPKYFLPALIPWVTSGETGAQFIRSTAQHVSPLALKETNLTVYPVGTLIVAMYGQGKTRGQVAELCIEATTNQACAAIVLTLTDGGHRRYIKMFFEKIYHEIRELAAGGAQPNLNLGKVKATKIPFPPLAEQHRIVAKVDELMGLCDQLEANLATTQSGRTRLLDALLHEALAKAA